MIRHAAAVGEDEQWAPVSDLMAVLMLIFMFIAIIFIRTVVEQEKVFQAECDKIYQVLDAEFGEYFRARDIDLLKDLTVRFRNPDVLFLAGSAEIRPEFKDILSYFFPRYMESVIPYRDDIQEIRIEGHTSSEYESAKTDEEAYFLNMELSQNRTRAILRYVLELPKATDYSEWARSRITANGLSSSRTLPPGNNEEDKIRSRRVEFRLLTSSCQKAGVGVYGDEN